MIDVSGKIAQARAHFEAGRTEQARVHLERALRQNPGHPELSSALALVLMSMGRLDLALYNAERAVQARPKEPAFLQNLGNILTQLARHDEAIAIYQRVLEVDPRSTGTRLGLSHALRHRYRFAEATAHLREALAVVQGDPELLASLSPLLLKQARVEEAVEVAEDGLQASPDSLSCAVVLAHALNYMPAATGEQVLTAHRNAGRLYSAAAPKHFAHRNTKDPARQIRVGLLSGDFRSHAVSFFLEPFLEHHDRGAMHITCFSTTAHEDAVTARFKSHSDSWCDLRGASADAIAAAIYKNTTDILLELSGHMAGHNLPAIAMQPAPVQVSYLGYPATTGLPEVTHRLVDSLTDPNAHEAFSSEQLIRLDPSFLCYRPPDNAPAPSRTPRTGGIAFGSFNSAPKINRNVIRVWARLLNEVPDATLILKALEFFDPALGPDILARFAAEGVDPSRIQIHTLKASLEDHLGAYNDVDIALDTFPYNGTTTTFEALFMGVPVVTLRGDRHVARVSAAILTNLGVPELIADNEDQYVRTAEFLARDSSRRAEICGTLRDRLIGSILCDGKAYSARMDTALRGIWRQWCENS
jgi:protein O-GlcNAc transferase